MRSGLSTCGNCTNQQDSQTIGHNGKNISPRTRSSMVTFAFESGDMPRSQSGSRSSASHERHRSALMWSPWRHTSRSAPGTDQADPSLETHPGTSQSSNPTPSEPAGGDAMPASFVPSNSRGGGNPLHEDALRHR